MPAGDQSVCHGNGSDHCCYWQGVVCPFLEEDTVPGRRWACGLLRELGDWDLVHDDPRYATTVEPLWRGSGDLWEWLWQEGVRCGTWPASLKKLKVKGNDPQWMKDWQVFAIGEWQLLNTEPGYVVSAWCCFGNAPYAQDQP